MKVNELMVGDYIHRPDCIDKVVEIRKNSIIGIDSQRGLIDFRQLEPIILTEEILVKNGWKKKPLRYFIEWYGCFQITEHHKGRFFYAGIALNYVHELQHLLRLCGIEKEIEL